MSLSLKMTREERLSVTSLSAIMALRMLGLFMVLPVFSLYAHQLSGATPALIGLAIGVYGLSQALFQIPFGNLSDRMGRKPVVLAGLFIFIIGSVIAGFAHSINTMIIGRALQGGGAIGSTILAFIADLTRENQRTKAMALAGMTIGFSFSAAMFIGPVLTQWLPVNSLFFLAAAFGLMGILVLIIYVPKPVHTHWHGDTEPEFNSFIKLLFHPELAKLNIGIFILHAIFTASFVVIPINLSHMGFSSQEQWEVYLPALLTAFMLSLVCMGLAEKKHQVKSYFLGGIAALFFAEILLCSTKNTFIFGAAVSLFFAGFSLLEAFLPSLISQTAPAARKGSALGIYSCSQFSGIFIGGVAGGWLYGQYHFSGVYFFCIALTIFWSIPAYFMQPPRRLVTQMWPLSSHDWNDLESRLRSIPGIAEKTFIADESMVYLKIEREALQNPDFIHLKEQLQSRQS